MWRYRRKASPKTIKITLSVWASMMALMCYGGRFWNGGTPVKDGGVRDGLRDGGPPGLSDRALQAATRVTSVPMSPCGWIPPSEVEAIVGPLRRGESGPLTPVRSVERLIADSAGAACAYWVARGTGEDVGAVVVEVDLDGAAQFETVSGAMGARLVREIDGGATSAEGAAPPVAQRDSASGWDYQGGLPMQFVGRVGHVGIRVGAARVAVPRTALALVAARVRDRIPDLPFVAPPDAELAALKAATGDTVPEPPSTDPDPCALLTRQEAEAVLGTLNVAPYRSRSATALAEAGGPGCTYYAGRHRALVIKPEWRDGRMLFGMAKGVGAATSAVVAENQPADARSGPWNESVASAMTGELFFLKGDRMLRMVYRTSSTDLGGAMRLARAAVGRL